MSSQVSNQRRHNVHFFKIILESSLRDGDLRIPRSFVKQYGKELSTPVLLRLPNGVKWKVDWIKRDDGDIWFQKVWERFAQYYSLSFGHFLVFRYEGRSNFQVLIFDMSALEIDYSSIRSTYEDVEILDDNGRPRSPLMTKKTNTTAQHRSYFNPLSENKRKKHDNTKINLEGEGGSRGGSFRARNFSKTEAILKRKGLYTQSNTALERARKFETKYPSFIQTIYPSYLKNYLAIPAEFSKDYLRGLEGTATIWFCEDKTWPVAFKFNATNNRAVMSSGWMSFVQENNLKEGDVCLFEMIDPRKFSFKVNIFLAREEEPSSDLSRANLLNQEDKPKTERPIQNVERGFPNGSIWRRKF